MRLFSCLRFCVAFLLTSGVFLVGAAPPAVGQNCPSDGEIFIVVEEQPTLIGGIAGMQEAVVYPRSALEDEVEGRVFVQGIVDTLGNVVDPLVTRGIRENLNSEALRVFSGLTWTPGVQDGEKVCVQVSLPVTFQLPDPEVRPYARAARSAVRPGERLTYVMRVANPGVRVEEVRAILRFPDQILDFSPPSGMSCQGLCTANGTGTWLIGTLGPGESRTLFYRVQFADRASVGTTTSTILASALNTGDVQSTVTTDIEQTWREQLHISSDPGPVAPGDEHSYRVSVGNPDSESITGVVRIRLPDDVSFVSATEGGQETEGLVFWPETTINGGDGAQAQFRVVLGDPIQEGRLLDIEAEWIPTSPTASTSLTSIVTPIRAGRALNVEYSTDRSAVAPGEEARYTLTLTNTGPNLAGVSAQILLPQMVEGFGAGSGLDCGSDSLCEPSEIITWDLGTLTSSESDSLTFDVSLSTQAPPGQVIRSLVLITLNGRHEMSAGTDLVIGADTPLPVEFASFSGTASDEAVTLSWQTAAETNNAGFDVERSVDGDVFTAIGFEKGQGTTTEAQTYRFVDTDVPFADTLHYRLRQVDLDGTAEYSSVVTVRLTPRRLALLPNAPNPFRTATQLRYTLAEDAPVLLQVYDLLGRRVATLVDAEQSVGRYEVAMDGRQLTSGAYFVRLQAGAQVQTQRIAVVR